MYLAAVRFFHIDAGLPNPTADAPRLRRFFAASNGLDPVLELVGAPSPNQFSTPYIRPWHQQVQQRTPLCFGKRVASPFSGFCALANSRQGCQLLQHASCVWPMLRSSLAHHHLPFVSKIKATKTDPLGVRCFVYVGRSLRTVCPVQAVLAYLPHRGSDPGPFL